MAISAAGHMMIRTAQKDTVVHIPRPVGEEGTDPFPVSKGTTFVVDVIGLRKLFSNYPCGRPLFSLPVCLQSIMNDTSTNQRSSSLLAGKTLRQERMRHSQPLASVETSPHIRPQISD